MTGIGSSSVSRLRVAFAAFSLGTCATLVSANAASAHKMHPPWGQGPAPALAASRLSSGQLSCQDPKAKYYCYLPSQIRGAYDVQPVLDAGTDGSGRTIAIVDAFQNPTMATDLARFDSESGIAAPPSFKTIAPYGLTPYDVNNADQASWSGEIALDVEWAHAIAPGAKILLVLAPSDADADITKTVQYVVQHHLGDVVSMSFGEAEQCLDPNLMTQTHEAFQSGTRSGITFVAAAQDQGAAQFACTGKGYIKAVSTPGSDPFVTSVGGTNLQINLASGAYGSESVWNDPGVQGAGGGGFSSVYARPGYQSSLNTPGNTMRGLPDVTYSASGAWGVYVAWGSSGSSGQDWSFYGTSCGTPQWAAIFTLADETAGRDLGNVNPALYGLSQDGPNAAYHDITDGNNSFPTVTGYPATPGWDAASGLGSPIAGNVVAGLVGR